MDKIRVLLDATAPSYDNVKHALESNNIEVIDYHDKKIFDEELKLRFQELKDFEKEFGKNFKIPFPLTKNIEQESVRRNKARF